MSYNEEITTLNTPKIPMLEAGVVYTRWTKAMLNELMHKCPNVFKHLITEVEPNFDDPELDVYDKIARTTDSDGAALRATLSETELLLPVELWDIPGVMYDTEDALFFYKKEKK